MYVSEPAGAITVRVREWPSLHDWNLYLTPELVSNVPTADRVCVEPTVQTSV